jgi:hypothetical protein
MVLAVDAGHQMKKDKVVFTCFNHHSGGVFVGLLGVEKLYQRRIRRYRNKRR